mmetsp:Transcript_14816/g.26507  ORF Transcript_14816/g.26507 Transcript_14816/m.26507 type:complete len:92 (-) Transcript_14816:166-441(-)
MDASPRILGVYCHYPVVHMEKRPSRLGRLAKQGAKPASRAQHQPAGESSHTETGREVAALNNARLSRELPAQVRWLGDRGTPVSRYKIQSK